MADNSRRRGFFSEWVQALRHSGENPVAGWLLTARERRVGRQSLLRRIAFPAGLAIVCIITYFMTVGANASLTGGSSVLEQTAMFFTVALVPAIFAWSLGGIYSAVIESFSLLADENRTGTGLTIDDMINVSTMSNADITVGALQVIMPQLFWRCFASSLAFWWLLLMLTSFFGSDLRAESFINCWIWGIVTVPLMLLSSLLACLALVLGCIAAGLRSRGALVPLTTATLVMISTLAWFFVGGKLFLEDQFVPVLTGTGGILGSVVFLVLALLTALLIRRPGGSRAWLGVLLPLLAGLTIFSYLRFVFPNEAGLGSLLSGVAAGITRAWGSFSLLNPLYIPSPASWGDMFLRNPVTSSLGVRGSFELRWLIGFLTQLGLVWINGWLAWQCISSKRGDS